MNASEKIPSVRSQLVSELGREPMLTEVAAVVGCTRERVRQVYKSNGWDSRAGQRAVGDRGRRRALERRARIEERQHRGRALNAQCVELAREGKTLVEIALIVDRAPSRVQLALNAAGVRSCWRFTDDEDAVVLDPSTTAEQAGMALNRSPAVIAQRRVYLRNGAKSRPDREIEILEAFDRLGSWSEVAREVGVGQEYVRRVVQATRGGWYIHECRSPKSPEDQLG